MRDADRCFVTQAGFHPGLPAAYLRKGVGSFDRCDTARVAMVMNERVEDPYSLIEIVDMVADFRADVFENGAWRAATWRDAVPFDFGPGFGRKKCYPMDLVEVRSLPAELGLRNAGVYVAGFNWFTDYVVFPLVAMAFAIRKGLLRRFWSRALTWGVNTFGSDRHGVVFLLQADGELAGRPAHLEIRSECDSAYDFTVIPVVACLMQVLDRSVRRPGIHMMGHLVDPDRLLADMERMGVRHRIEWTPAVPSETRTSP